MNDFVAFDVETANPDFASICQIGIARFADGQLCEKPWEQYVNPKDFFHPRNVAIHHIDDSTVIVAPTFPQICQALLKKLGSAVVIHHSHFDRTAMRQVFAKYGLPLPQINWLDSMCVVRRTWPDLSKSGYGLESVAKRFGIEYQPHHAAEDARAAGEVFVRAMKESRLSADEWMARVRRPITARSGSHAPTERITRDGNPDGPLYGQTVVFTGTLVIGGKHIPRQEAADLVAAVGCDVAASVTKKTNILIVGDQDIRVLAGHEKSKKLRYAEALMDKGQEIRIVREADAGALVVDYQGDVQ